VGGSLGVAVIGAAVVSGIDGPMATRFAAASHTGWWIVFGCGLGVLGLGLLTSGRWARGTADRTAAALDPPVPDVMLAR
jgi:hypothetical protein